MKKYSLYKNGIHLYDFDTITACAKWLENIIGGSLGEGLGALKNKTWQPTKASQLYGYEINTNELGT